MDHAKWIRWVKIALTVNVFAFTLLSALMMLTLGALRYGLPEENVHAAA